MDEKLVEQISTDTGVPQELVSRSAQARAQANGVDVNAILASWSSGEAPAVSSAPVETVVEEAPVETVLSYVDEEIFPHQRNSQLRFLELYSTEQFLESLLGLFRRLL